MADNVAVTAGSGTSIAADEVVDATLGTVKVQYVKIMDGTLDGTTKAAVGANGLNVFAKINDGTDTLLVDSHGSAQTVIMDSAGNAVTYDIGVKPMNFAVAATTLTRPANVTQYSVNDSVSNNATAGSVTALSASVSDTNDAPVNLTHITLDTNDTGIGAATTSMRIYVYNSDPTASTGVGAGDNAAFSNKKAGLVATFVGTFIAMSDGGKCICVPESGAPYIACKPTSAAKTLFVQHQITGGTPTPSANSTTIDTTLCGFQGRAT